MAEADPRIYRARLWLRRHSQRIAAGYGSSVSDIVFAPGQFEPVSSGTFWSVSPSASAYEAADRALAGGLFGGSPVFCSPYGDCSWFMEALTLVTQHGGHLFSVKRSAMASSTQSKYP